MEKTSTSIKLFMDKTLDNIKQIHDTSINRTFNQALSAACQVLYLLPVKFGLIHLSMSCAVCTTHSVGNSEFSCVFKTINLLIFQFNYFFTILIHYLRW